MNGCTVTIKNRCPLEDVNDDLDSHTADISNPHCVTIIQANDKSSTEQLTAKGDMWFHNGTDPNKQAIGTNEHFLICDSAQTNGVRWNNNPNSIQTNTITEKTLNNGVDIEQGNIKDDTISIANIICSTIEDRDGDNVIAIEGNTFSPDKIKIVKGGASQDKELYIASNANSILWLESDIDNITETHNPSIYGTQDGGNVGFSIGNENNSLKIRGLDASTNNVDIEFYHTVITNNGEGNLPTLGADTLSLCLRESDNYVVATELVEAKGIDIVAQGANPGDSSTLWIYNVDGHVYRGSVDLEIDTTRIVYTHKDLITERWSVGGASPFSATGNFYWTFQGNTCTWAQESELSLTTGAGGAASIELENFTNFTALQASDDPPSFTKNVDVEAGLSWVICVDIGGTEEDCNLTLVTDVSDEQNFRIFRKDALNFPALTTLTIARWCVTYITEFTNNGLDTAES